MTASRLRVGQLFALTIGFLVVFAVAGGLSGLRSLDSLAASRHTVVDRIDPTLVASKEYLIGYVNQETGVRGYALGGDPVLLAPYHAGRVEASRQLAGMRRLVRGAARPAIDSVVTAAGTWSQRYARPTIAAVAAGDADVRRTADVLRGKQLFDVLRGRLDGLETVLQRQRAAARASLSASARRVRLIVIAFACAILVGVLAAAIVLRRTVVTPLGRLAADVRVVREGDFDAAIDVAGAREVVELGADVEAMRARIVAERNELERSNAELEQFAYVASHDLQEPLRKVASFTQMLQRRYSGELDERADTYIEFAVDGAKRMQDLINDLLAFSRVGRLTQPQTVVDAGELIGHAIASLSNAAAETGARIEVGDELPSVRGEASLLELVFTNLISNGIKFRSEERPLIEVSARPHGEDWCFTVRDNGIGIEPEYADRIFVIFQRLHPRSVYDGTGIGLSMCRKIVEYHGGTIWLDRDAAGPGATFHFTLPMIKERST